MDEHLHVIPVGFDAQRLVKPLSSGTFTPDRVLLVRDEHDPEGSRTSSPHGGLLREVYETVRQDLEHYIDVEVDECRLPLFSEMTEVFQAFYTFFDEQAHEGRVTFNLSSAPKSTALALAAARATWVSEHPDRDEAVQLYYFKPRQYLETQTRNQLSEVVSQIDNLARERNEFRNNVEGELADALVRPVKDSLQRVKEERDEVEAYIQDTVDEATNPEEEQEERLGMLSDAVDGVASTVDEIINREGETSEDLTELEAFLSKAEDLTTKIEENPTRTVEGFRTEYRRRITDHSVPDRKSVPLMNAIDELENRVQTMVETRDSLRNGFESLHREIGRTEQAANRADDLLNTISRIGMTEGIRGSATDWNIPLPPTADLREVEKAILYVLASRGDQRSVQALARATAEELRDLSEEIGAHPSSVEMETELMNCCIRMESDSQLGDDFEEFLANRLRNRLQYNLQSLEDKGYIHRREAEDDSRRVETALSATGELWTSINEFSEIRKTAIEEELREQLQQFVE